MHGGELTDEERELIHSAHRVGLIRTSSWPGLAAELLARGVDGDATRRLAGLSRADSPWSIDPLVPDVLAELGGGGLDEDAATWLVARAMAQVVPRGDGTDSHPTVRALAALSPALDYPGGAFRQAYDLESFLDYDGPEAAAERAEASALERVLADSPLAIDDRLLAALTDRWI